MGPDDPLIKFVTNPALGFFITFLAACVTAIVVRSRPSEKGAWEELLGRPGQFIFGVSLVSSFGEAFPRLVYDPYQFHCNALSCWATGGQRVVEGTGLWAFVVTTVLSILSDLPFEGLGFLIGLGIATVVLRPPQPTLTPESRASKRPAYRFNPPPNWPPAPRGFTPPPEWRPDPAWPPPPRGWPLWIKDKPRR